ncbi:hypothetical protein AB4Y40_41720 [Paraburkholderia sp. EG287B]|uniref:hypothetical protein n=1 Tax=Paraburkholderia sp. EG287B TaxID=3237010 RepID=UPI0034D36F47
MMNVYSTFFLGAVGGAVPDILRLIKVRHDGVPKYLRTKFFWAMALLLSLCGGLVALFSHPVGIKEALAFGFSAPQIISGLLGSSDADRGSARDLWSKMRAWWAL